jgi:RNA polymerase sigma-70 factor (ECF subfamily)
MKDQDAISRLKQGDLNSLGTLVRRYQARAVQAAYAIVLDRALAEDVVQTAFVRAAERIEQFDDGRPFAPWFLRIVVNDALKLARKQKRDLSLEEELDQPTARLAQWLADPGPQPDQVMEQKEIRQSILKAIRSLPPGQRAAIVMRYYLDMSMLETSAETGRPLSTIKWWLRDGRRRLRGLMDAPRVDGSGS